MFGSTKLTPQEEVTALIGEIRDTRTAYDNATDEKWRAQYRASIGLRLSALVRATRKLIDSGSALRQSTNVDDSERCIDLEARAGNYLNSAARIAAFADSDWPIDIRREIETQSVELITAADTILDEVRAIVIRHVNS